MFNSSSQPAFECTVLMMQAALPHSDAASAMIYLKFKIIIFEKKNFDSILTDIIATYHVQNLKNSHYMIYHQIV